MKSPSPAATLRSQWLVRDDRSGTLKRALQAQINDGGQLLARGMLIGDRRALRAWGELVLRWRDACAELLGREFEKEALLEFLYASRVAPVQTEHERPTPLALDAVQNAIELLMSLRGTLAREDRPARSRQQLERPLVSSESRSA